MLLPTQWWRPDFLEPTELTPLPAPWPNQQFRGRCHRALLDKRHFLFSGVINAKDKIRLQLPLNKINTDKQNLDAKREIGTLSWWFSLSLWSQPCLKPCFHRWQDPILFLQLDNIYIFLSVCLSIYLHTHSIPQFCYPFSRHWWTPLKLHLGYST